MENPSPQNQSLRGIILFVLLIAALAGSFWVGHKSAQKEQKNWGTLAQAEARFLFRSYMFLKYLDTGTAPSRTENINSLLAEAGKVWGRARPGQPNDLQLRFASVICLQAAGLRPNYLSITTPGNNPKFFREYALQTLVMLEKPDPNLLTVPGVMEFIDRSPVRRLWLATIYERQGRTGAAAEQWRLGYKESAPYVIPVFVIYALWGLLGLVGFIALIVLKKKPFPRPETKGEQISLGLAAEGLLAWLAGQIVFFPGLQAATRVFPSGEALFSLLFSFLAAVAAVCWLWLRGYAPSRLGWKAAPVKIYLELALAVFVLSLAGMGMAALLQQILHRAAQEPSLLLLSGVRSIPLRVAVLLVACTLIPIAEEVLFRGILYRGLRTQWGPWVGALLSSALFAAGHLDVVAALPIFVFGLGLCWSVERSNSLVPAIIAHGLFNLFPLLVLNVITF